MIRYSLRCADGHGFEAWFRDSAAFDAQSGAGAVDCPVCGSTEVEKALMAPSVAGGGDRTTQPPAPAGEGEGGGEPARVLSADPRARALVEAVKRLRRHVVENADYVGPRFAEEARKIHYEEAERRDIYGEASLEETRKLLDEGIDIAPLPDLPEEKN